MTLFRLIPALLALSCPLTFAAESASEAIVAHAATQAELDVPGVPAKPQDQAPRIQIAVLLDTSNSMDGLINQARAQLWSIVNQLSTAKRDGVSPHFEVALYEYGKQSLPASENFLRLIVPLTTDLDTVSQQLFALTTNGGEEFCGAVIRSAQNGLTWSTRKEDLKMIIIAGNEPFTQGAIDYRPAVLDAYMKHGIIINTIHCGSRDQGVSGSWAHGAELGGGMYGSIDQDQKYVDIATPHDKELAELGSAINDTYIPYGAKGEEAADRQVAQDDLSNKLSTANFAQRAYTKANSLYCNDHWDLVDAIDRNKVKLAEVPVKDLPDVMQKMTPEQRTAYVAGKAEERKKMQKRINDLTAERNAFISAHHKKNETTLDHVVNTAVKQQAEKCGFKFDNK